MIDRRALCCLPLGRGHIDDNHFAQAAQLVVPQAHAPRDEPRIGRSRRRHQNHRIAGQFGQRQATHHRLAADGRVPGALQQRPQSFRTHLRQQMNIQDLFLVPLRICLVTSGLILDSDTTRFILDFGFQIMFDSWA